MDESKDQLRDDRDYWKGQAKELAEKARGYRDRIKQLEQERDRLLPFEAEYGHNMARIKQLEQTMSNYDNIRIHMKMALAVCVIAALGAIFGSNTVPALMVFCAGAIWYGVCRLNLLPAERKYWDGRHKSGL